MALHFTAEPKLNADNDLQKAQSKNQGESDKVGLGGMALTLAVLAFSGRRKCLNLKAKGGG